MGERLCGTPRGVVVALERLDHFERTRKQRSERREVVAGDGQPTAMSGTALAERGEDDVSAGANRIGGTRCVRRLVLGGGQEVQCRSVMPHIDRTVEPHIAHIGAHRPNPIGGADQLLVQSAQRGG
ncbi:MAG: hypothetical protein Q8M22_04915 [Actinomycetota bacterium]|nr:hypothetical protein [Actinomycetota bacterium]